METLSIFKRTTPKDRTFILAILFSAAWHVFWLSTITVVTAPKETGAISFSKVSFLGPILQRSVLEVRIDPSQRSFLEKRCLDTAEREIDGVDLKTRYLEAIDIPEKDYYSVSDKKMSEHIKDAVDTAKLEPHYGFE